MHSMARHLVRARCCSAVCVLSGGTAGPAAAQQSVTDVLTFLLTNRSIRDRRFRPR